MHGSQNPLVPHEHCQAEVIAYPRAPGLHYRRVEGRVIARCLRRVARARHGRGRYGLVMGVSLLPDGEAAVGLGAHLRLPVVTIAIGSDVLVYPQQLETLKRNVRNTLEGSDLVIGVSRMLCRHMKSTGACRRDPQCVYLGRDMAAFSRAEDRSALRQRLGWDPHSVVAIYSGNIAPGKGISELCAAARELCRRYPNFRLVCLGDGPEMGRLRQLRDEIGRAGAVDLPGLVPPDDVPEYLQASDFMVFPSHSEGMPQAVLEAMNCGLPVVASEVGGIPEAVVNEGSGVLIPPRDVPALVTAMERMVLDEPFRLMAGRTGLQRARTIFDAETNNRKLAHLLTSLVSARDMDAQGDSDA